jgi:sugar phosphate isomerase/epimerase
MRAGTVCGKYVETFQCDYDEVIAMELAVFNDGLAHLTRREALRWCAERGVRSFELGVGGWRQADHADLDLLLREQSARRQLLADEFDISLGCINAAGNPLHPDPAVGAQHAAAIRGAIELADLLGVGRVVTMSGCPGGPGGGGLPIFAPWALNCDCEDLWSWQWRECVQPFWTELGGALLADHPRVQLCIELHAGAAVYNPSSFRVLNRAAGGRLGLNLDPSHFWWMGIDPLRVVAELGDLVGWLHAKDTIVREAAIQLDGVFDFRYGEDGDQIPWRFGSVGDGHPDAAWHELLSAAAAAGYDGPASIEYEEPPPRNGDTIAAGVERSLSALRRILPVTS